MVVGVGIVCELAGLRTHLMLGGQLRGDRDSDNWVATSETVIVWTLRSNKSSVVLAQAVVIAKSPS
ncbi:MAG: hypothetical protein ACRDRX_13485 [Pseudonocardiaceae bacterium]